MSNCYGDISIAVQLEFYMLLSTSVCQSVAHVGNQIDAPCYVLRMHAAQRAVTTLLMPLSHLRTDAADRSG